MDRGGNRYVFVGCGGEKYLEEIGPVVADAGILDRGVTLRGWKRMGEHVANDRFVVYLIDVRQELPLSGLDYQLESAVATPFALEVGKDNLFDVREMGIPGGCSQYGCVAIPLGLQGYPFTGRDIYGTCTANSPATIKDDPTPER